MDMHQWWIVTLRAWYLVHRNLNAKRSLPIPIFIVKFGYIYMVFNYHPSLSNRILWHRRVVYDFLLKTKHHKCIFLWQSCTQWITMRYVIHRCNIWCFEKITAVTIKLYSCLHYEHRCVNVYCEMYCRQIRPVDTRCNNDATSFWHHNDVIITTRVL